MRVTDAVAEDDGVTVAADVAELDGVAVGTDELEAVGDVVSAGELVDVDVSAAELVGVTEDELDVVGSAVLTGVVVASAVGAAVLDTEIPNVTAGVVVCSDVAVDDGVVDGDAVLDAVPDDEGDTVDAAVLAGVADAVPLAEGVAVRDEEVVDAGVPAAVDDAVDVPAGVPEGVTVPAGVAENTAGYPVNTMLSRVTVPPDEDARGLALSFTHKPAKFSAPAPRSVDPAVVDPVDRYKPLVPYVAAEGSRLTIGVNGPATPTGE